MNYERAMVPFYGSEILSVCDDDGNVFVPLRPISDRFGLSWTNQHKKVNKNNELYSTVVLKTTDGNGKLRDHTCLPLNRLNIWLAKLTPSKVLPKFRKTLKKYQIECADALYKYWFKGVAHIKSLTRLQMIDQMRDIELDRLELERENDRNKPKVSFFDSVVVSKTTLTVGDVAKSLGVGKKNLFKGYRLYGVLDSKNTPYQQYIDNGICEYKFDTVTKKLGVRITTKGHIWTAEKLHKQEIAW